MDFLNTFGPGAPIKGIKSLFGYKNPADKAMPYLDQMMKELPQYFKPYMEAGGRAMPKLEEGYGSMLDPGAFMKKMGAGFQSSPGYEWQKSQGLNAITGAASSGGMLGTPQHQQEAGELAGNLANQDFYNYLTRALDTFKGGLEGEQNLYTGGKEASMGLGQDLASITGGKANLAYEGQNAENQHKGQWMQMLSMLPYFLM